MDKYYCCRCQLPLPIHSLVTSNFPTLQSFISSSSRIMEPDFQPRMKRKDFEHVDDDFSDFSFTSPATKIRRLDAEVPPMVIVEEEPEISTVTFDQSQPRPERCSESRGVKIEELPDLGENEERAIVLFQPSITTPIVHSPSNFSVSVHPHLLSGLKNQILRPNQANSWRLVSDEATREDGDDDSCSSSSGNGCQAVVPWFPPRFPSGDGDKLHCQLDNSEMMDAEEMGEASMDVEENEQQRNAVPLSQGLPQWQHCTILQPPQNTTTPIVWYR